MCQAVDHGCSSQNVFLWQRYHMSQTHQKHILWHIYALCLYLTNSWLRLASRSWWVFCFCTTATSTVFNGVQRWTLLDVSQCDSNVTFLWHYSLCPGALYQALGVAPSASKRTIRLACLAAIRWVFVTFCANWKDACLKLVEIDEWTFQLERSILNLKLATGKLSKWHDFCMTEIQSLGGKETEGISLPRC